jgi:hypothetical protein
MGRRGVFFFERDRHWILTKAAGEDGRPFTFAQGRLPAGGTPALLFR